MSTGHLPPLCARLIPTFSEGGEEVCKLPEGINAECSLAFLRPSLTVGRGSCGPKAALRSALPGLVASLVSRDAAGAWLTAQR